MGKGSEWIEANSSSAEDSGLGTCEAQHVSISP
jgi:hypothetical protein